MAATIFFFFRESWVGSRWLVLKQPFFAIFDPTWIHILPQAKRPKYKEFSKQHYNFQSIRKTEAKTEALLLPICDILTKVKFLKIIQHQHYFLLFKMYSPIQNMKKIQAIKCQFLYFFHNIGINLAQVLLLRPHPLCLLTDF